MSFTEIMDAYNMNFYLPAPFLPVLYFCRLNDYSRSNTGGDLSAAFAPMTLQ